MCRYSKSNLEPQIIPSEENTFSILFWNIHGQNSKLVGNKFSEKEFLRICENYDLLGLAELHTESFAQISGFKLIKQKIRKKAHKGPKISGGLAVFAKQNISHMVKPVINYHEDSI